MRTTKKVKIIYLIFVLISITAAIISGSRPAEQLRTDKYGISRDSEVELSEDRTVACVFDLKKGEFQGVQVKFLTENSFQNEKMKALLYDVQTDELLASDIVELKYERIQNKDGGSLISFQLPVKDTAGKTVRLEFMIEGEDSYVYPSLVLSESEVEKAQLLIDGEKDERALVFNATYAEGTKNNAVNAIVECLFWILLGGVVCFFICSDQGKKRSAETGKANRIGAILLKIQSTVMNSLKRWKLIAGYGVLVVFLGVLLVYTYQFSIEKRIKERSEKNICRQTEDKETISWEEESENVKQTFLCTANHLSSVSFKVKQKPLEEHANIQVIIKDESTGKVLQDTVQLIKDNKKEEAKIIKCTVPLAETLEKSKNRTLSIELISEDFEAGKAEILSGTLTEEQNESAQLTVNDKKTHQNMALTLEFGNVDFLKELYVILCVIIVLFMSIIYYAVFVKKASVPVVYAVTAISLGILYLLIIGVNTVPDEPSHIDTAYAISNEVLGVEESTKSGYIYKRVEDIDAEVENKQSLNAYSYERLHSQFFSMAKNEELVEYSVRNNLGNAGKLYYIPQALGLTLGRILGVGMMPALLLGRLFSLLACALIGYFAVKKMPLAKVTLLLIGILPITLQQSASFSYDGLINAIAFLYVSYCLYAAYSDQNLCVKEILVILLSGSMIVSVKGGVYAPLLLLPAVILAAKKKLTLKEKRCLQFTIGILVLAFLKTNLIRTINHFLAEQGTVTGGAASTTVYTFTDLIKNPLRAFGIFVNTFYEQGDAYLRNMFGGNLAWRDVNISWGIVFAFVLIILLSCVAYKNEKQIGTKEKLCMLAVVLASFLCVELSMWLVWTPLTYTYITGVQGRYFIPFLILGLLPLRGFVLRITKQIDRYLIFAAGLLNICTLLQVIQRVLE